MAKNVRISDELYALAQAEAFLEDRSIAQQLERWAKLGLLADTGRNPTEASTVQAAVAMTRRLDRLDVANGRFLPESLHFVPGDVVRRGKPRFPDKYRKS